MVTRAKKIADLEFIDSTITGGTIDNATVGATTPSSGSFTDVSSSGSTTLTRDSGTPLEVNRTTDTGDFATFSEDGVEKGVLGGYTDGFVAGSDSVGIMFDTANNCIRPIQTDGTANDGGIDLGFEDATTQHRFKNLRISGIAFTGDLFSNGKGKIGNSTNNGGYSLVVGDLNNNIGYGSIVGGIENSVNGGAGFTIGYDNTVTANGSNGITFGAFCTNNNLNNLVGGDAAQANGSCCVSIGKGTIAGNNQHWFSTALGYETYALGNACLTGGTKTYDALTVPTTVHTSCYSDHSIAFGAGCRVFENANNSIAFGWRSECGESPNPNNITANQSMAIGYKCRAYKDNSFAGGNQSYVFGDTSFAFGNGSVASNGFSNVALGRGITTPVSQGQATTAGSVCVGQFNEHAVTTDQHFAVGTGSGAARYTSFYVGPRTSSFSGIVIRALKDQTSYYSSDYYAGLGGVPLGGIYQRSGYMIVRRT